MLLPGEADDARFMLRSTTTESLLLLLLLLLLLRKGCPCCNDNIRDDVLSSKSTLLDLTLRSTGSICTVTSADDFGTDLKGTDFRLPDPDPVFDPG
jgi:hypothetical protein